MKNSDKPITPAQYILQQDVTRKEFMTMVALGLISIFGFTSVIHFLTGHNKRALAVRNTGGYNSGPYGG